MEDHIICPQCKSILDRPTARLVQDSCGHRKCRMCLLNDEIECRMCNQDKINRQDSVDKPKESVIKYNIITCNKLKSDDDGTTNTFEKVILQQTSVVVNDIVLTPDAKEVHLECGNKSNLKTKHNKNIQKRNYKCLVIPNHISVIASNPPTYKCNVCSKSFLTKTHVKYHKYCAGGEKPLKCVECSKEFINNFHFETHRLQHSGSKPFECDLCEKSFNQRSKLKAHKLSHSSSKPFVCPACGKTFKSKEYLRTHALIHKIEKPFSCKQCNAKFSNCSNLNRHLLSHSKDKTHMCDQCGKRFKLKWALTVHRRSHTKLRPYKCSNCSKEFMNSKELQRHRLVHIDAKPYSCSLCGTSFRRKDNVERHIRNTHPGKKATSIKTTKPTPIRETCSTSTIIENPNAINVITASPSCIVPVATKPEPTVTKPVPVINGPLKLAFKTTAFKSHYNIHSREYVEPPKLLSKPYDMAESLSICQKILSPCTSSRTIIKTLGNVSEKESTEICQKILSPISLISNQDLGYDQKPHAIRNIKFKLPPKYVHLPTSAHLYTNVMPLNPVQEENIDLQQIPSEHNTYAELKTVPSVTSTTTSVIVNQQSTCQKEIHWRRRTLQNFGLQSKNEGN